MPRVRKGAARTQARKRILRAARGYYGSGHKSKYKAENALIRAGVSDAEMLSALGVDTERLFALTFAAGAALAGLAGVVGTPVLGLHPGTDDTVLIRSLIVVVVGGLGTLSGAILGSFVVGPADTFGALLVPEFALALIFMVMALVLLFRPAGLFGRR